MYRVSALLPSWDRSRQSTSSAGSSAGSSAAVPVISSPTPPKKTPGALDKVFGWAAGRNSTSAPAPAPARYGRETYWPTSLDKECDKAARVIKSFCCACFPASRPPVLDTN